MRVLERSMRIRGMRRENIDTRQSWQPADGADKQDVVLLLDSGNSQLHLGPLLAIRKARGAAVALEYLETLIRDPFEKTCIVEYLKAKAPGTTDDGDRSGDDVLFRMVFTAVRL